MAVFDINELSGHLPSKRALLGLDLGEKTIGVAVSDISLSLASPLELIRKTKFTIEVDRIFHLMTLREACGIVIGLPVNMDGTEGPRCQSVRAFARHLCRNLRRGSAGLVPIRIRLVRAFDWDADIIGLTRRQGG